MRRILFKTKSLYGFTLIEVLISVLIFSIISIAVYEILVAGEKTFYSGLDLVELQSQVRTADSYISRELREATSFSITALDANNDKITFSTPNKTSVSYYRDVNDSNGDGITEQIIREYPVGTRRIIARYAGSLKFSSSGNLIEATLIVSRNSGGRQLSLTSLIKVNKRNE